MVNVGIVGLGKMGILHAGVLNALSDCTVTAICEKESLLNRFAKKLLPKIAFYEKVSEMLEAEQLDSIYITTPIITHGRIVEEIFRTGRKVALFIEKPLATSYADSVRIAETSAKLTNTSMIGFQKRFSPIFQRAKHLLETQALGELLFFKAYSFVSGVFSEGKGWRFEAGHGGALLDLGSHLIDILLWYFGNPTRIQALERSFYGHPVDDYSHVVVEFQSGLTGYFDVSWSMIGYRLPETKIEVFGTNGKITVSDDYLKYEILNDVPSIVQAGKYHLRKPDFDTSVDFLIGDPEYCLEDRYFLECVEGKKVPMLGLDAGVVVNKVIEQVRELSKVTGRLVH